MPSEGVERREGPGPLRSQLGRIWPLKDQRIKDSLEVAFFLDPKTLKAL